VVELAAVEAASEGLSAWFSTSVFYHWGSPHAPPIERPRATVAVYLHDGGQGVPPMHVPCWMTPCPGPQASRAGRPLPV